jgi:hypothetical protein
LEDFLPPSKPGLPLPLPLPLSLLLSLPVFLFFFASILEAILSFRFLMEAALDFSIVFFLSDLHQGISTAFGVYR